MPQARTSPRYGPEGRTLHAEHTLDRVCKKAEGAVPAPRTGQRIACTQPARYPIRGIYVAPVRARAAAMECLVSGLVDCGWGYDQVKDFISKNNMKRLTA